MSKHLFLFLILFIFSTPLFSKYTEKKIPKPEIRKFDTLKISDLTNRIQINTAISGDIWFWNNLNDSKFEFKINKISFSIDKYSLFYKGLTAQINYNVTETFTTISLGYKFKLYEILYSKLQLTTAVYPYFDLGISTSLGIEFSLFNLLRLYSYNNFTSFIINGKNTTSLYYDYNIGIGVYF